MTDHQSLDSREKAPADKPRPGYTLIRGAIDMHRHGYPEISPAQRPSLEDVDDLARCRDAGMRGVVMKSHVWPTMGRVHHLRERVPGLEIYSSITLNTLSGGLNPLAVQMAAAQGAKVVFLPTWSSHHDRSRQAMSSRISRALGIGIDDLGEVITLIDGNGKLTAAAKDVLQVAEENAMVVSTGHISTRESLAIAESGILDNGRLIFAHPDSHSVGASKDQTLAMASLGCVIEICALGALPPFQRITIAEMADLVLGVGPDNCVFTSDYFFEWSPPSAEVLRMVAMLLAETEVGDDGVRSMLVDVPARLLAT